ncbi:hypothetical protein ACSQ76_12415 [Roseovarius sp. B08]|uniref:hypothetical protein n=1 Tax=Roseovarius sp. B08 TaxID=3449223 RepID=UPI003EDC21A5
MLALALHDRAFAFLSRLDRLEPIARREAFINEVLETGGVYAAPPDDTGSGRFVFEVVLHDIRATGATEDDAVSAWIDAAQAEHEASTARPIA